MHPIDTCTGTPVCNKTDSQYEARVQEHIQLHRAFASRFCRRVASDPPRLSYREAAVSLRRSRKDYICQFPAPTVGMCDCDDAFAETFCGETRNSTELEAPRARILFTMGTQNYPRLGGCACTPESARAFGRPVGPPHKYLVVATRSFRIRTRSIEV
jgi:hypothetical protein